VVEYAVAANTGPLGIVAGPDGKLWFTEMKGTAIGSITALGVESEYPMQYSQPARLTVGSDGNLWVAHYGGNRISLQSPWDPNSITWCSHGVTDSHNGQCTQWPHSPA